MENENMEMPSYWPSVIIGALFVGIVSSIFGLVSQYMTINSEPTGAPFTVADSLGIVSCLVAAFGGFISVRHYAKENDITFKIGKGAVIGLFVGFVGTIVGTVINLIWTYVIDTNLTQNFYDWQIRDLETQNLPQEQFEMALNFIPEPGSISALLWVIGFGLIGFGIVNLITGIIAAKVFASEE